MMLDIKSHLLLDRWNSNFFDRLIPSTFTSYTQLSSENQTSETNISDSNVPTPIPAEVLQSKIGSTLWDDFHRVGEVTLDAAEHLTPVEEEDLISQSENQHHSKRQQLKSKVGNRNGRKKISATQVYQELSGSKGNIAMNPHKMVKPFMYGDEYGPAPSENQPFKIIVHPQVGLICDIHGHLCEAEVIGLLAGRYDHETKCLYIQAPFPCTATERVDDDGSTDVELDAEAEWQARDAISKMEMHVVGWYHSHPRFRPDPSITDIINQQQHQCMMETEESLDVNPFVGLIVSTFDPDLPTFESYHQWFHVRPFTAPGCTQQLYLPMLLNVSYAKVNPLKVETFQEDSIMESLFDSIDFGNENKEPSVASPTASQNNSQMRSTPPQSKEMKPIKKGKKKGLQTEVEDIETVTMEDNQSFCINHVRITTEKEPEEVQDSNLTALHSTNVINVDFLESIFIDETELNYEESVNVRYPTPLDDIIHQISNEPSFSVDPIQMESTEQSSFIDFTSIGRSDQFSSVNRIPLESSVVVSTSSVDHIRQESSEQSFFIDFKTQGRADHSFSVGPSLHESSAVVSTPIESTQQSTSVESSLIDFTIIGSTDQSSSVDPIPLESTAMISTNTDPSSSDLSRLIQNENNSQPKIVDPIKSAIPLSDNRSIGVFNSEFIFPIHQESEELIATIEFGDRAESTDIQEELAPNQANRIKEEVIVVKQELSTVEYQDDTRQDLSHLQTISQCNVLTQNKDLGNSDLTTQQLNGHSETPIEYSNSDIAPIKNDAKFVKVSLRGIKKTASPKKLEVNMEVTSNEAKCIGVTDSSPLFPSPSRKNVRDSLLHIAESLPVSLSPMTAKSIAKSSTPQSESVQIDPMNGIKLETKTNGTVNEKPKRHRSSFRNAVTEAEDTTLLEDKTSLCMKRVSNLSLESDGKTSILKPSNDKENSKSSQSMHSNRPIRVKKERNLYDDSVFVKRKRSRNTDDSIENDEPVKKELIKLSTSLISTRIKTKSTISLPTESSVDTNEVPRKRGRKKSVKNIEIAEIDQENTQSLNTKDEIEFIDAVPANVVTFVDPQPLLSTLSTDAIDTTSNVSIATNDNVIETSNTTASAVETELSLEDELKKKEKIVETADSNVIPPRKKGRPRIIKSSVEGDEDGPHNDIVQSKDNERAGRKRGPYKKKLKEEESFLLRKSDRRTSSPSAKHRYGDSDESHSDDNKRLRKAKIKDDQENETNENTITTKKKRGLKKKLIGEMDSSDTPLPKISSQDEGAGIITLLRNVSLPSVMLGRKILFTVHPEYRSLSLTIISLGFYYCQSKKKTNLSEKWKDAKKLNKLLVSAAVWGKYLGLERESNSSNSNSRNPLTMTSVYHEEDEDLTRKSRALRQETRSKGTTCETNQMLLIPNLVEFLRLCWEDVHSSDATVKRKRGRI